MQKNANLHRPKHKEITEEEISGYLDVVIKNLEHESAGKEGGGEGGGRCNSSYTRPFLQELHVKIFQDDIYFTLLLDYLPHGSKQNKTYLKHGMTDENYGL
jgi:hypothetical protein